ncbi:MafI family immunity protein [Trabulsiella odontotermitis]|nr:MafI family immunity protein [Trabulsiella odontotermitis]
MAFKTLCDHLADHDVVISKDEYTQLLKMANNLGLKSDNRYTYIDPENY